MRNIVVVSSLFVSLIAAAQSAEVVILTCTLNASPMTVVRSTQSSGAPATATGTNCAQALADLATAGFVLHSVDGARAGSHVLYTAVKPAVPPQCGNGVDDDGDGLADLADPQCTSATDTSEST